MRSASPSSNVYNNKNQIGSLLYDSAGNQLTVNGNNATYDGESRVTAVTETPAAGGGSESFDYDGLGQRVQKTVSGGATTVYVYDAFGQVAAEYSTASNPAPCSTCYLLTDALGSTRLVTDQNANPVTRHDFVPFGEEIAANTAGRDGTWGSTTDVTQKFTGQVRDPETGLDYFNARYYAPALGRFTSPDPGNAGADPSNPQTWNAYAYVNNNPLSFVDPSGQSWGDIFGGIGSFFSGLGNALGIGGNNCNGAMFCVTHTENSPSGPPGSYAWWMSGGWQQSTGGGGGGGTPQPKKPTAAPAPPKSGTCPAGATSAGLTYTPDVKIHIEQRHMYYLSNGAGAGPNIPSYKNNGVDMPASQYIFEPDGTPSANWQLVTQINAKTFSLATPVPSRGNVMFTAPLGPQNIPVPLARPFIGMEYGGWLNVFGLKFPFPPLPTDVNTLVTKADCQTVVTSHPGHP